MARSDSSRRTDESRFLQHLFPAGVRTAAAALSAIMIGGAADAPSGVYKADATVNGEVITESDVDQRLALVIAANDGQRDDASRATLRSQVLGNLIDETLEFQAAKSYEIEVADDDVERAFRRVAQNFGRTPEAFGTFLLDIGSSATSIRRRIRGEIAWFRLLDRRFKRDPSQARSNGPVRAAPSQDPRDAVLDLRQVTLSIAPDVSAAQASDRTARFVEATGMIQSCEAAADAAKLLGATVTDAKAVPIRNFPPQLQEMVIALQIGRATPPFGSRKDGVRVLVLCGRSPPPDRGEDISYDRDVGPDLDRARRYLRDLRQDAVIVYR